MNKPKYNIGDVIINSDNNLADNIIIVIMRNTDVDKNNGEDTFYYGTAEYIANAAVKIADDLIKELSKTKQ